MRKKGHREITRYALLYLYPDLSAAVLKRIIRAVCRMEKRSVLYLNPESHAQRVPFASQEGSLDLLRLYFQESRLRLADAHERHQHQRVVRIMGECIHFLQDFVANTGFVQLDKERRETVRDQLISGSVFTEPVLLYAAPRTIRLGKESDPLTFKERDEPEIVETVKDEALQITLHFLRRHRRLLSDILAM